MILSVLSFQHFQESRPLFRAKAESLNPQNRRLRKEKKNMEATAVCSSKGSPFLCSSRITTKPKTQISATFSPFLIQSMATEKPLPSVAKTVGSRNVSPFSIQPHMDFWYYCSVAFLLMFQCLNLSFKK
ncbi:uncharacterized protein LOC111289443 [Durio zibethinus]|uniref:Uncharacterized protein LOC111289443 n=1 Tax=Durio zibethinus TaxID=66656 RepID=A0A6P5Y725_DURZI|nr:uncharacterized protein LOC111289443 [Durio zibethinus]